MIDHIQPSPTMEAIISEGQQPETALNTIEKIFYAIFSFAATRSLNWLAKTSINCLGIKNLTRIYQVLEGRMAEEGIQELFLSSICKRFTHKAKFFGFLENNNIAEDQRNLLIRASQGNQTLFEEGFAPLMVALHEQRTDLANKILEQSERTHINRTALGQYKDFAIGALQIAIDLESPLQSQLIEKGACIQGAAIGKILDRDTEQLDQDLIWQLERYVKAPIEKINFQKQIGRMEYSKTPYSLVQRHIQNLEKEIGLEEGNAKDSKLNELIEKKEAFARILDHLKKKGGLDKPIYKDAVLLAQ